MTNETIVTLQGWVGGAVTLRTAGDTTVAGFRLACTPRRFSRRTQEWVDAPTQWYTVNAWRALGDHCEQSLQQGDPVIVHGRLGVRPYVNKAGTEVFDLEVDAMSVGHDLSRGTTSFVRAPRPAAPPTAAVEESAA